MALLFSPLVVHAQEAIFSLLSGAANAVGTLVIWIFVIYQIAHLINTIVGGVFIFCINFITAISQYNQFLGARIVTLGWAVTRDFANLFLVIALLVIAFATILSIHSYQAQDLMKKFLFAAVAVNFSKMICGILIDAAQVVMMTFVAGYSDTAAANFINLFQVKTWLAAAVTGNPSSGGSPTVSLTSLTDGDSYKAWAMDLFSTITSQVFAAIIAFFGVLAVMSLIIVLVVRIITLWFLITVAPLAFVASVLPATKSYADKWWSEFFKQLVVGPIVAFIIWVSLASISISDHSFDITADSYQSQQGTTYSEATAVSNAITMNKISQWDTLGLYFIPIILFLMGAKWAVSMSGGLAQSASGWMQGKLKGYASSGVGFLKKQATTGHFGVVTQTARGLTGRSTALGTVTGLAGNTLAGATAAGVGIFSQAGAANIRRKAQTVRDFNAGGNAAMRKDWKKTKDNFARRTEMGKQGEEYEKMRESGEAATYLTGKANKEYDAARARVNDMEVEAVSFENTDPDRAEKLHAAAEAARQSALGKYRAAQGQATESRKEAVEGHKKMLDAAGLKDPIALRDHLQKKISEGPVDQAELEAIQEKVKEHYDKEESKRVSERRAQVANEGGVWTAEEENKVKGEVAAERSNVTESVSKLARDYGQPPTSSGSERRLEAVALAQEAFKTTNVQKPPGQEARVQGEAFAKALKAAVGAAPGSPAANTTGQRAAFGSSVSEQVGRAADRNRTQTLTPEKKAESLRNVVLEAVGQLPPQERHDYLTSASADTSLPPAVQTAIQNAASHLASLDAAKLQQQIQDRWAARDNRGDAAWSASDVGMQRNPATSRQEFSGAAAASLQKLIADKLAANDASVITRMKNEITSSTEGSRVVGSAITTNAHLDGIMAKFANEAATATAKERKEIIDRAHNIARAVMEHGATQAIRDAAAVHLEPFDVPSDEA